MKTIWRFIAWLAGLAVLAMLAVPFFTTSLTNKGAETQKPAGGNTAEGGRRRGGAADGPIPVLVAPSRQADVPVYVEGVGTGKALNTVNIRSQVDGILMKLNFIEGQDVKAGDVIALIDPRLYQATLDQNIAKKAQDQATLENARRDLERYRLLAQTKAGTQQQYDTQKATVAADEAQVRYDQAQIDYAQTNLSYTTIRSPIDGRTGIRNVDVGNIVHATDTTGIVTISQIKPISVIFNVPQQELPRINKSSLLNQLDVQALNAVGDNVVDHGTLAVVDNQIDATTGTVRLRANFPNKDLQLWPGIFVNVRLRVETLKDAVTVPVAALQRGPSGAFVFTVADDKAVMRNVSVGQQDDRQAVITAGLRAGETVITSGFQKLTAGAKVKTSPDPAGGGQEGPALHQPGLTPAPAGGEPGTSRRRGQRRASE